MSEIGDSTRSSVPVQISREIWLSRVQSLQSYPPSPRLYIFFPFSNSHRKRWLQSSNPLIPIESMPSSVSRYLSIILFVVVPQKLTTYKNDRTILFCSRPWPICKPWHHRYISLIRLSYDHACCVSRQCQAAILKKAVRCWTLSPQCVKMTRWLDVPDPGLWSSWNPYCICWMGIENDHLPFPALRFDDRDRCPQRLLGCCMAFCKIFWPPLVESTKERRWRGSLVRTGTWVSKPQISSRENRYIPV